MIETEVILLKSVYDHIGEMVNLSMLEIQGSEADSTIRFKGMHERTLFYILLVDFLSKTDLKGPIGNVSFLEGLSNICSSPCLAQKGSEKPLSDVVRSFRNWLEIEREIDIWMPSISSQITLKLIWTDAIKMNGNVSKHNYLRAVRVAKQLRKLLKSAGKDVSIEQSMLALPDFYDRFHDDILIYLSSHICEFLNDIRWAIHTYLGPEFKNSRHQTSESSAGYSYKVPESIESEYAKSCYWDLMNHLRSDPDMKQFKASDDLDEGDR